VDTKDKDSTLIQTCWSWAQGQQVAVAALAAKGEGADVLLVDKGKLESSGCLGEETTTLWLY